MSEEYTSTHMLKALLLLCKRIDEVNSNLKILQSTLVEFKESFESQHGLNQEEIN